MGRTVTTTEEFKSITWKWRGPIVCDVETYGSWWKDELNAKLLGVVFCHGIDSIYIPITVYRDGVWNVDLFPNFKETLKTWTTSKEFIGHNFTYDKGWLDWYFGMRTTWTFDTRIGWHLADAPASSKGYGLKDAQKELLGWEESNEKELELAVAAAGGKLKNGDHYLAPLAILAKYACLDGTATWQLYQHLQPFFQKHHYNDLMQRTMAYNLFLEENTRLGVVCNRERLTKAHNRLIKKRDAAERRLRKLLGPQIEFMENAWADRKIATYKRQYNKDRYTAHPEEWERLNINSDKHKRELFYDVLKLPILEKTEAGKPSVALKTIAIALPDKRVAETLTTYENANTLVSNFTTGYLDVTKEDSRLHPGFNICGTVSYRLSGFKPYLLNTPFSERAIMGCFVVEPGYIGVHADLAAIEPTLTAHYSDDPGLLRVFRDGLGDVYLDLALQLFPDDKELHEGYNPQTRTTKEVKGRFERQRKIAKVIQLAVQYTGTKHTVSKNLTIAGIPTTVEQANDYVRAYWKKYSRVAEWGYQLRETNRKQGFLRNVSGRIIQVPDPDYKDLSNRFIQSGGHDVLILWVLEIYRLCKERQITIKPVLLDCHDSTSNQVPEKDGPKLLAIYQEALDNVNAELDLAVTIKMEAKYFHTLAGLKGDD